VQSSHTAQAALRLEWKSSILDDGRFVVGTPILTNEGRNFSAAGHIVIDVVRVRFTEGRQSRSPSS
jgi:hypothetical protein